VNIASSGGEDYSDPEEEKEYESMAKGAPKAFQEVRKG